MYLRNSVIRKYVTRLIRLVSSSFLLKLETHRIPRSIFFANNTRQQYKICRLFSLSVYNPFIQ